MVLGVGYSQNSVSSFVVMDGLTKEILIDLKLYLQKSGIDFVVVLIPRQEQILQQVFDNYKQQHGVSNIDYDRSFPQKHLIDNIFKPLGIKIYDLMKFLDGKDPITLLFPCGWTF